MPHANEHALIEELMKQTDRTRAIKDLAKGWHKYYMDVYKNSDPNDTNVMRSKLDLLSTFKQAMLDSGKWRTDEVDTFDREFQKLDHYSHFTYKNSILKYFYEHYRQMHTEEMDSHAKWLEDSLRSPGNKYTPEQTKNIQDAIDTYKKGNK